MKYISFFFGLFFFWGGGLANASLSEPKANSEERYWMRATAVHTLPLDQCTAVQSQGGQGWYAKHLWVRQRRTQSNDTKKEKCKHFTQTNVQSVHRIPFPVEITWMLLNRPNGHWVTPGLPSNTLFKSHYTQAQDFWTRRKLFRRGQWHPTENVRAWWIFTQTYWKGSSKSYLNVNLCF